ncbi:hypothetical protein [Cellulosilyticum ruminicola]|uniref:hypothetical protein n=1 Tax=Cellulosilyticum ruminicola TaxID=425254 RepID=UPI0006D07539|nr:hypothetical protein [Cellulosilyticum ruminicola]
MRYEVRKNPSTIFAYVNEVDVRMLTIENGVLVFECDEELEGTCKAMISVLDINTFNYEETYFEHCEVIKQNEGKYYNTYEAKIIEQTPDKIKRLETLLDQLQDVDKIFDETWVATNNLLKSKKQNMSHYDYEKDSEYCKDFEEQKRYFFDLPESNVQVPEEVQLAFVVSEFKYYKQIIETSYKEVLSKCLKDTNISDNGIFKQKLSRVYIGNDFCANLFPDEKLLMELVEKAYDERLDVTICYPPIIQRNLETLKGALSKLDDFCKQNEIQMEITVNDWGMIGLLQEENYSNLKPILGRLLNKRKKDTRMHHRMAYSNYGIEFGLNNLNVDHYRAFLEKYGITRYEFEAFNFKNVIPEGKHSLHFPFFQTNTASNCVLYANCKNHTVSKQELPVSCPHYCEEFYFSYPKHLNIIGKNNCIFGFDNKIFIDQEIIDYYAAQGIDRLAFTPL